MKWAGTVEYHICAPVRWRRAVDGVERVACGTRKLITRVKKDYCVGIHDSNLRKYSGKAKR
jgi:hypothetical protein